MTTPKEHQNLKLFVVDYKGKKHQIVVEHLEFDTPIISVSGDIQLLIRRLKMLTTMVEESITV